MARPDLPGDPWQYTTWEGAERAQLLAGRQLSLREKLAWLEEAAAWVEKRDEVGHESSAGAAGRGVQQRRRDRRTR